VGDACDYDLRFTNGIYAVAFWSYALHIASERSVWFMFMGLPPLALVLCFVFPLSVSISMLEHGLCLCL
jgi:hypothetical protein